MELSDKMLQEMGMGGCSELNGGPCKDISIGSWGFDLIWKESIVVMMLSISRWDHPGLEWTLSLMINVLRREEGETQMRRSCDNRSGDWIMQPQVKE